MDKRGCWSIRRSAPAGCVSTVSVALAGIAAAGANHTRTAANAPAPLRTTIEAISRDVHWNGTHERSTVSFPTFAPWDQSLSHV